MTLEQLQTAAVDALRRGDHGLCTKLMDQFIESASGLDLAYSLHLKASYLMIHEPNRWAEGLMLLEEARLAAPESPDLQMRCAICGLGLCCLINDTERARKFELDGHRILRDHGAELTDRSLRSAFFHNLGMLADLRREYPKAYWHYVQAVQHTPPHQEVSSGSSCYEFRIYLKISEVCCKMDRTPEACDALMRARSLVSDEEAQLEWTLVWAAYLHAAGKYAEAYECLADIASLDTQRWHPYRLVRYHLVQALVAQGLGDLRSFHSNLVAAQELAVNHSLDFLLCQIQRLLRTPQKLEAAR